MNLKPGDRVQWWEPFKNTRHEPRMMTGTVETFHLGRGNPWVVISVDEPVIGEVWARDVAKLTLIKEAEYDTRGEAGASPFAAICDDYEETMRWAGDLGDLGGVELV